MSKSAYEPRADGVSIDGARGIVGAWVWIVISTAAYLWQYRDMVGLILGALGFGA
jgi:hypothetical protein